MWRKNNEGLWECQGCHMLTDSDDFTISELEDKGCPNLNCKYHKENLKPQAPRKSQPKVLMVGKSGRGMGLYNE